MEMKCMQFMQVIAKATVDFQSTSSGILVLLYSLISLVIQMLLTMGNSHASNKPNMPTESFRM